LQHFSIDFDDATDKPPPPVPLGSTRGDNFFYEPISTQLNIARELLRNRRSVKINDIDEWGEMTKQD
jgi:hypothetical protein